MERLTSTDQERVEGLAIKQGSVRRGKESVNEAGTRSEEASVVEWRFTQAGGRRRKRFNVGRLASVGVRGGVHKVRLMRQGRRGEALKPDEGR